MPKIDVSLRRAGMSLMAIRLLNSELSQFFSSSYIAENPFLGTVIMTPVNGALVVLGIVIVVIAS